MVEQVTHETIRLERDQLQAIVESTHDAILMFDREGHLLRYNPAAQTMLGPLAPYIGRSFSSWLRDTGAAQLYTMTGLTLPRLRQTVSEIVRNPTHVTRRQFKHIRDEHTLVISETGSPVLDQWRQPVGWLLVWHDYTNEHRLAALRQEFNDMVVHDLRNPITSIISGLSMLRDLLADAPLDINALYDVVQITENSAENMLNLVQTLLDVMRLEQRTDLIRCESLLLSETIHRASASVLGLAMGAGISMVTRVSDDLPPVWIDNDKIHRVLVNLLDNALRHTPHCGEIKIGAEHQPGDSVVVVRIEDSGPGIPADVRDCIFEKFVQLDSQRIVRGSKGAGLGLTFCKLVIDAHKGRIWVEDSAAGGAAFCFTLPVVSACRDARGNPNKF